nr:hypothetical protein LKV13_04750 [Borrelia sp. BU AG58]
MSRKSMRVLILLLAVFVTSCEFWKGSDTSKASPSSSVAGSRGRNVGGGALATGGGKAAVIGDDVSEGKPDTGLTVEEVRRLEDFVEKTEPYDLDLSVVINNKYFAFVGAMLTYASCLDYSPVCFDAKASASRKKALKALVDSDPKKDFEKLHNLLKKAMGRDFGSLTAAISEFERVLKEAENANGKIEDTTIALAKDESEEKKTRNVEYLKKVRAVGPAMLKAMELAAFAYADAFALLVSGMSSSRFKEAVDEFNRAARKYAGANEGNEFNVIVYAIDIIVSQEDLDGLESFVKMGDEGIGFIAAIEKLKSVYDAVKPESEPDEEDDVQ